MDRHGMEIDGAHAEDYDPELQSALRMSLEASVAASSAGSSAAPASAGSAAAASSSSALSVDKASSPAPAVQNQVSDVEMKDASIALTAEVTAQLNTLLEQARACETEKDTVEEAFMQAQSALVDDFEKQARAVYEKFDAQAMPVLEQIKTLKKPIADLLEGKYVEISADTVDENTGGHAFGNRWTHRIGVYGQYQPGNKEIFGRSDVDPLSFIDRVRNKRRHQHDAEVEQKKKSHGMEVAKQVAERKKAERAEQAVLKIMPIMPHLSPEEASLALEINADNADRTIDWLLNTDPVKQAERFELKLKQKKLEESKGVESLLDGPKSAGAAIAHSLGFHGGLTPDAGFLPPSSDTPSMQRLDSADAPKLVVFKALKIHDDMTIELKVVLDRNRIPADPVDASRHVFPLKTLLADPRFRIPSAVECLAIERDKLQRVPVITFQAVGDEEFSPINISPPIKLAEYKLEWDSSEKTLKSCRHHRDGPVLFQPVLDESLGFAIVDHSSPIELYTQVIDNLTHNIVHMHIDDTRSDIAVDTANLTDTNQDVEEHSNFATDVSGRKLTYKVLVKNQKVLAVLYQLGNQVKRAAFVERPVPAVNTTVLLPGNKYGVITRIPTGLIVTRNPRDMPAAPPMLQRSVSCARKHPTELDGQVEVQIQSEGNEWLVQPKTVSAPLCQISVATESQLKRLADLRTNSVDLKVQAALAKLKIIEDAVEGKKADVSVADLSALRKDITDLQAIPTVGAKLDNARIQKAFNGIRVYALNARTQTSAGGAAAK